MAAQRPSRRTGRRNHAKGKRGRCPTGKVRYRIEADAVAAARVRTETTGIDLYVYECSRCSGWHRTSLSPQQYRDARAGGWATGSGQ